MKVGPSKKQLALEEQRIAQEELRTQRAEKRELLERDRFAQQLFREERARLSGLRGRSLLLTAGEMGFPLTGGPAATTGPKTTPGTIRESTPIATQPGTMPPLALDRLRDIIRNLRAPGTGQKLPKRGGGGGTRLKDPSLNRVFLK